MTRSVRSFNDIFFDASAKIRKRSRALSRYEAAGELERWFDYLAEGQDANDILQRVVVAVTDLFLSSDDNIRRAIETGFLEHVLEQRTLRHWFSHWAFDERLQEAWRLALAWGDAHPNFVKGLRAHLEAVHSDEGSGPRPDRVAAGGGRCNHDAAAAETQDVSQTAVDSSPLVDVAGFWLDAENHSAQHCAPSSCCQRFICQPAGQTPRMRASRGRCGHCGRDLAVGPAPRLPDGKPDVWGSGLAGIPS